MSVKKMNIEKYHEYLTDAGCEIDLEIQDSPNHIWFSHGGLNYLLRVNSGDDGFVEIAIPYELDGSPEHSKRYEVCNHIARTYKLVKCFYTKDAFVVSAETFVRSSVDFKNFLKYCLSSVHVAYEEVAEAYPDGV